MRGEKLQVEDAVRKMKKCFKNLNLHYYPFHQQIVLILTNDGWYFWVFETQLVGLCEFIKPWVGTTCLALSIHSIPVGANKGHFQVPTMRFGETNAI